MRPLPKYELDDTANSNEVKYALFIVQHLFKKRFASNFSCRVYVKESEEDNELHWKLEIVGRMMEEHLLTDACLQHLAAFVAQPSERLTLYHEKNFTKLSQSSAVGILEKSKKVQYIPYIHSCFVYITEIHFPQPPVLPTRLYCNRC
jgi:hypothetical protein